MSCKKKVESVLGPNVIFIIRHLFLMKKVEIESKCLFFRTHKYFLG